MIHVSLSYISCAVLFGLWFGDAQAIPPLGETDQNAVAISQTQSTVEVSAQPSARFVCPHTDRINATECFIDATEHLYTVCRQVKAIELIEHGFDKAEDGANAFKSDFCRRKQKVSMPPYFDAALREAQMFFSCETIRHINELYAVWHTSLFALKQRPDETETEYQQRITVPYLAFAAYRQQIHESIARTSQNIDVPCPTLTIFKP
ncbi:MAG: hypothetical protein LBS40_04945 [Burkholderiales bacterium]|jgi:hypothetical protein|nr:hypothetical protein [Burkholderiales bacterium]